MVIFLHIPFVIVLIFFTIYVTCADKNEALHFSRIPPFWTIDYVFMKTFKYPQLGHPSATACSANSEEVAFNEENSLSKKSMFVRSIYEGEQTARDVHYHICENPYEMTVLYHNKDVEFQFGFEIYYDKSEYADKGFGESYRGDYDLITNSDAYINYIKPYFSQLSEIPGLSRVSSIPTVSRFLGAQKLYLDADRKKEMGFLWIDAFRMKFNFKAKRVAQTIYGLSLTTRGIHECDNYDLGKEFFNGLDINDLYKENNQKRMLNGVKLPKESDDNYKEIACESENLCFAKWSSVPKEVFHHLAAKPISCSDLLTVPVWKSTIYDVLNKLDYFLFTLSVVLGHPVGNLTVHSGVHGVLQLPTDSYIWSKKSITLDEKAIQVPDVIYKLVKYKTYLCQKPKNKTIENDELTTLESKYADEEENDKTSVESNSAGSDNKNKIYVESTEKTTQKLSDCILATASIIVVIHNNPYFNYATDKICEDVCKELGWELIKQAKLSGEEITSKYIYCCSASDTVARKKLGINNEQNKNPENTINSDFSLKYFPMYDFDTQTYKYESVYNRVIRTFKRLFKDDKFQTDVYEKTNLLFQHFHVRSEFLQIAEPQNDGDGPDEFETQFDSE